MAGINQFGHWSLLMLSATILNFVVTPLTSNRPAEIDETLPVIEPQYHQVVRTMLAVESTVVEKFRSCPLQLSLDFQHSFYHYILLILFDFVGLNHLVTW